MAHDDEQAWRAAVYDEYRRISTLDDTIAGTLNNVLVGGSVGIIVASVTFLKDIAGGHPAPGSLLLLKLSWIILVVTAAVSIAGVPPERPRPPKPGHRDKAFDHDTSNPFLQRPDTTTPPKKTEEK